MRRVPHPQPTPLNPPVYGREKLRSASFTTQLRPVSLSSNDVKVKQTAEECLLELLTNAGPEGMDIERLARKVSVSVFKKFGCKSFAENVFLELINNGPFRREVIYVDVFRCLLTVVSQGRACLIRQKGRKTDHRYASFFALCRSN